jgi:uncharacterized protein
MLLGNRLTSCRCVATASLLRRFRNADLQRARYASDMAPSSPPSTLLSRLSKEVLAALRAKDKTRLSALRSLLADVTNSSKTASPIKDDLTLLVAIRKRIASTKQSIQQFGEAGRPELVASEEESLRVLEEYAGKVKTMSAEEVREQILHIVAGLRESGDKLHIGEVMKACLKPGGVFEGRMVEKSLVAKTVTEVVGSNKTP